MKIEVSVATMGQTDLSLYDKMNLSCDAVIANQCDRWHYREEPRENGRVRMLSTATRGVGVNRNLALELADTDVILFADDDVVYYDGTLQGVREAFDALPDADVIVFGMDMTRNGEVFEQRRSQTKRLSLIRSMKFGTYRIAVRRQAVEQHHIRFSTLFGGGALYGSGEDSLFLRDCFRVGLKVYAHSYVLGRCAKDVSSWFRGYDQKYLFDKGAWIACAFPKAKHLIKWYFVFRFAEKATLSWRQSLRCIDRGMTAFRHLEAYTPDDTENR